MNRILAIALTTFREALRGKILLVLVVFAAIVVLLSTFFGAITVGDQVKVIKDFGLFGISLFSVLFAVISGANLLHKELARKTIYNILSKPVLRGEFIIGKYLGMVATAGLMIALMGLTLSAYLMLFEGRLDPLLFHAYLYAFIEIVVVSALTILFSAVLITPVLSGILSFAIFLAGRTIEYLDIFLRTEQLGAPIEKVLRFVYWCLPHLNEVNVADGVVYGIIPGADHLVWAVLYSVAYSGVILTVACLLFSRREFN